MEATFDDRLREWVSSNCDRCLGLLGCSWRIKEVDLQWPQYERLKLHMRNKKESRPGPVRTCRLHINFEQYEDAGYAINALRLEL
jgi:hypothetical protein